MMVEGLWIKGLNSAELRLREILAQSAIQSLVLEAVNKQPFFSSYDGLWKLDMVITVACRCSANLSSELPPMRGRLGIR